MTDDDAGATRIAELEADNRRLRRLLDQRDAPEELRHRGNQTEALIRTIVRQSAVTPRDLESYAAQVEDRLDALARAQAALDQRGVVELQSLLADEFLHYGASEGDRVVLSGPDIDLFPRAARTLALAVHELAVNAIEHGSLGSNTGDIAVTWHVEDRSAPMLDLSWKEQRSDPVGAPIHRGFGMEVLLQMLPYQLQAEVKVAFEPYGVRCTIRLPLSHEIGRIAED